MDSFSQKGRAVQVKAQPCAQLFLKPFVTLPVPLLITSEKLRLGGDGKIAYCINSKTKKERKLVRNYTGK